ncbi:MAG: hypothetical protein M1434_01285 [Chloroflexi bacterium]|nr:hypothetical protein [Chloroflexota bacterium]MCL5273365.1 hypothetical protein [Chloroflexota bacterium]
MQLDRGVPTILYTNGTFITGQLSDNHIEIMQGKFSRKEVCALLNTLDQTGFLNLASQDWDQNTNRAQYEGVMADEGAPSTIIEVNAWLTQTVSFYELNLLLNVLKGQPDSVKDRYVPKVIRDTDSLLAHTEPRTLTSFVPNRLALVVRSYGQRTYAKDYLKWPLSLPLSKLISSTLENVDQIVPRAIEGPEATWFYRQFYQHVRFTDGVSFSENGVAYSINAFPLFPFETFAGRVAGEYSIPSSDVPITTTPMTCYPADGVLPIP